MAFVDIKSRKPRRVEVDKAVASDYALIESEFNGEVDLDNGQGKGPFLAFRFPAHEDFRIGVRLNKHRLTLYVREQCPDGRLLESAVPGAVIAERYQGAGTSIVNTLGDGRVPYLDPARAPVLRVEVRPNQLRALLAACLAVSTTAGVAENAPRGSTGRQVMRAPVSPDDFLAQLDRRSVTGQRGEQVAMDYERARLSALGCPEPDPFVRHIALDDVGAGYDIESAWPGHERFIEVKSTAGQSGEFFISAREREVLLAKGRRAWVYRVSLGESGASVQEIHDPMNQIPDDHFTPQVWKVKVPG